MLEQLTLAHQSTMVEQLLVKYNIALPRYIKQAELIGVLISELYTDAPELDNTPGEYYMLNLHTSIRSTWDSFLL